MTEPQHLSSGLHRLASEIPLPPGRLLGSGEGLDSTPVMWMSDDPAPVGLWKALHGERERSGLWPLLLAPLHDEAEFRPWRSQELYPHWMSSPDGHDAAALVRGWWHRMTSGADDERQEITAPYGRDWPGLAPSFTPTADPDEKAGSVAAELVLFRPELRIGLVPAVDGAQALAACGWSGPTNHQNDMGKIAAVLRSWQHRFGARVVGAGFDTLHLSVAAPPVDMEQALLVAAEHLAVCPDNILQGTGTLTAYAEGLLGEEIWPLWWD